MIADCEKIATSLVIAFINPSYITDVLFPLHECVRLVENHTSPTIDIWNEKTSRVELTYRIGDISFVTSALNSHLNYWGRYLSAPAYARAREADKLKVAKKYLMVTLKLIVSGARNRTFV